MTRPRPDRLRPAPPRPRRRVATAVAAALLCGASFLPAAAQASFRLEITEPRPLFLLGRCVVEAAAFAGDGRPHESIAFMTLAVDGRELPPDAEPPFRWDLDVGEALERHRLELSAVSRAGEKATLSALSSGHAFIEAVSVDLVLVPVVAKDRAGRAVADLAAGDFTVLEDGAERPVVSFSNEPLPASIVVALDNSRSMERQLWSAQRAVIDFLEAQPRYAVVSLLTFNDQVFLEQEFTPDRDALTRAVAAVRSEGTRTALYDALRIGSRHLARRTGARVLVLFTDGEETLHEGEEGRLRTALEAAQQADVAVFAVAYGPAALRAASLERMASETGGEVVAARGAVDLREAFARVAESLGARYLLGYHPPEPQREGYRSIEVRVSRSEVTVLARRGYWMRRR